MDKVHSQCHYALTQVNQKMGRMENQLSVLETTLKSLKSGATKRTDNPLLATERLNTICELDEISENLQDLKQCIESSRDIYDAYMVSYEESKEGEKK